MSDNRLKKEPRMVPLVVNTSDGRQIIGSAAVDSDNTVSVITLDEALAISAVIGSNIEPFFKVELEATKQVLESVLDKTCKHHVAVQHRDNCPPWCNACGLTEEFGIPMPRFNMENQGRRWND